MTLPYNLSEAVCPEETAIVGDIEAFFEYLESGQAAFDYDTRMSYFRRLWEEGWINENR